MVYLGRDCNFTKVIKEKKTRTNMSGYSLKCGWFLTLKSMIKTGPPVLIKTGMGIVKGPERWAIPNSFSGIEPKLNDF